MALLPSLVIERSQSAAAALQVLLGLFIFHLLLKYLRDQARNVPGPLAARFTRLWYFRQLYAAKFHETNVALHQQHGIQLRLLMQRFDC